MSSLSNQLTEGSLEVLTKLVRSPGHRLAEKDAHELGLDIEILAAMYEANVKPYLDFILGYEDLAELDPQNGRFRWNPNESWTDVLRRHGIVLEYRQVVEVLQDRLYTIKQNHDLHIAILLSRKGQWIVWHKRSTMECDDTLGSESVAVFRTIEDMCKFLNQLVTNDYKFRYQYSITALPKFIPLRIARGLLGLIESTIAKRQEYLASFQSAHDEGSRRLGLIEFKGQ